MTTGAQKDKTDSGFVENLKRERYYERRTAAWIDDRGLASVYHPPLRIRNPWDDPRDFADGGDLEVRLLPCEDPGDHRIVEVKHLDEAFTGRDDFPYRQVFVGNEWNFPDYPLDLPVAVFAWNREGTHFAIVYPEKSFKTWRKLPFTRRGKKEVGVFCPVENVSTWVHDETHEAMRRAWHCDGTEDAFFGKQDYERSARASV